MNEELICMLLSQTYEWWCQYHYNLMACCRSIGWLVEAYKYVKSIDTHIFYVTGFKYIREHLFLTVECPHSTTTRRLVGIPFSVYI